MGVDVRMARWRVDMIRHRAERLGTVEAADEKRSRRRRRNLVSPERKNRIVVARVTKNND
jgi:hypothetical protein